MQFFKIWFLPISYPTSLFKSSLFSVTSVVLNYFLKQAMEYLLHVCKVVAGVYAMSSPSSWPFLFSIGLSILLWSFTWPS